MNDRSVGNLIFDTMYLLDVNGVEKEDRFMVLPKMLIHALLVEFDFLWSSWAEDKRKPDRIVPGARYRGTFAGIDLYQPREVARRKKRGR